MMLRGIPIPKDPFKLLRMIDWYNEEKKQEYMRTVTLVTAMLADATDANSVNSVKEVLRKYEESIWPKDKIHEELIAENKEKLEEMSQQALFVREISMSHR